MKMAFETEDTQLNVDTLKQGVSRVLLNNYHGFYLIVSLGEIPISCSMILFEWSDWRAKEVIWIHSLYVLSEHRSKGVFKALYAHLIGLINAHPENYAGIRLFVEKSNINAQHVYRKIGMTAEHYDLYEWLT